MKKFKAKLNYNPVELDPEEMCKLAVEQPQVLQITLEFEKENLNNFNQ